MLVPSYCAIAMTEAMAWGGSQRRRASDGSSNFLLSFFFMTTRMMEENSGLGCTWMKIDDGREGGREGRTLA